MLESLVQTGGFRNILILMISSFFITSALSYGKLMEIGLNAMLLFIPAGVLHEAMNNNSSVMISNIGLHSKRTNRLEELFDKKYPKRTHNIKHGLDKIKCSS